MALAGRDGGKGRKLGRRFYTRPTLTVAHDLLGCRLVRRLGDGHRVSGIIVETEAYVGEADRACHAAAGRTERNAVMFGPPGHAYVYLIYGLHFMLNVVTERREFPAAVLIRAVEPDEGQEQMARWRQIEPPADGAAPGIRARLASGPGRLSQAFGIDRDFDGIDLCSSELIIESGPAPDRIVTTPRIGVDYAGSWSKKPWRYLVAGSPYVSRAPGSRRATRRKA